MTNSNSYGAAGRVLIIGKSQLVLDETLVILRGQGYAAQATNQFDSVLADYDVKGVDLVVFGGQVPPDTRERLTHAIAAVSPSAIFVRGLSGIPGLIAGQVAAALGRPSPESRPAFNADTRSIDLKLTTRRRIAITLYWQTSFVPPDPKSDSLVLVDGELLDGAVSIAIPDTVPDVASFAVVAIDNAVDAFSIATRT